MRDELAFVADRQPDEGGIGSAVGQCVDLFGQAVGRERLDFDVVGDAAERGLDLGHEVCGALRLEGDP